MQRLSLRRGLAALAVMLLAFGFVPSTRAASDTITRVSVGMGGAEANQASEAAALSADGRFVAFESVASNLVPGDTNRTMDIFVYDRQTGTSERVNLTNYGGQTYQWSLAGDISADGRFVVFESVDWMLKEDRPGGYRNIFVRDRQNNTTEFITLGADENSWSINPDISADGRFVAFLSDATNLVPGDANYRQNAYVYDRQGGTMELISVSSAGALANHDAYDPSLSADGRFVAFQTLASNLVPDDTNDAGDVFVHDRQTGVTELISADSAGAASNGWSSSPAISADGRFVTFTSNGSNLAPGVTDGMFHVFLHDRQTGANEVISVDSTGALANNMSGPSSVSADGRFVTFSSYASNLVADDTNDTIDVFVHDRQTGTTKRISVDNAGNQANGPSTNLFAPAINDNGTVIAFDTEATNLVPDDTNDATDVFVYSPSPES